MRLNRMYEKVALGKLKALRYQKGNSALWLSLVNLHRVSAN